MSRRWLVVLLALSLTALSGLTIRAASRTGATIGATVVIDPTVASVSIAHSSLKTGQGGKVTATVTNRGAAPISSVRLAIVGPLGLAIVPGPLVISTLGGRTTGSSTWTVCASQAGNYVILARATALDQVGRPLAAESGSVVLLVTGRPKVCR